MYSVPRSSDPLGVTSQPSKTTPDPTGCSTAEVTSLIVGSSAGLDVYCLLWVGSWDRRLHESSTFTLNRPTVWTATSETLHVSFKRRVNGWHVSFSGPSWTTREVQRPQGTRSPGKGSTRGLNGAQTRCGVLARRTMGWVQTSQSQRRWDPKSLPGRHLSW